MDRVVRRLPAERRREAGPSRTASLPLRDDDFARAELEQELRSHFDLAPHVAEHLVTAWGAESRALLEAAPAELRRPIGSSRYLLAEIPWAIAHECPATLSDLLERRVRLALFAEGQGLPQLAQLAGVAAAAAGWDAERTRAEAAAYASSVRRQYQIVSQAEAERAA
jgi:glycerol-3-phosphate dehydrogenase